MNEQLSSRTVDQRQRLLEALFCGSVSTLDARKRLDIMHPAARIKELREMGFNIVTHWALEPTKGGKLHKVARYAYLSDTH